MKLRSGWGQGKASKGPVAGGGSGAQEARPQFCTAAKQLPLESTAGRQGAQPCFGSPVPGIKGFGTQRFV